MIPVLHKIGDQWAKGELDVATEHVCSNAAITLIDLINQKNVNKKIGTRNAEAMTSSSSKKCVFVRQKCSK